MHQETVDIELIFWTGLEKMQISRQLEIYGKILTKNSNISNIPHFFLPCFWTSQHWEFLLQYLIFITMYKEIFPMYLFVFQMDSLKFACENSLRHHLDEDTALFLLSLADQFSSHNLKVNTFHFWLLRNYDSSHFINLD